MNMELPRLEDRTAIDCKWPITLYEGLDWREYTSRLANDIIVTANEVASHMGRQLPDNYGVDFVIQERDTPLFAIVRDEAELEDVDTLFDQQVPLSELWIRLKPTDGTEDERPVAVFDNDDEHARLYVWGASREVTVRGTSYTVRPRQTWNIWNYNAAKRKQGYSEEDFPGDEWKAEYDESIQIIDGPHAGDNLSVLLHEFDAAIDQLEQVGSQPVDAGQRLNPSWRQREAANQKLLASYRKILGEVSEATGITPHTTTGEHALQEGHDTLAAIRRFVAST